MIKQSERELISHIENTVLILKHMCKVFDDGSPYICFSMATEVEKILTSNSVAVDYRSKKLFPSPISNPNYGENNLLAEHRLIEAQILGDIPTVDFLPVFRNQWQPENLKFVEWWNRDIIFRAGAAKPGSPPGYLPPTEAEEVPYKRRSKLTRREFVDQMRNKLGAHIDAEVPELLNDLQKSSSFGITFAMARPDGSEVSTSDGTLPTRVGPAAAMMRQISHELLVAYGSAD